MFDLIPCFWLMFFQCVFDTLALLKIPNFGDSASIRIGLCVLGWGCYCVFQRLCCFELGAEFPQSQLSRGPSRQFAFWYDPNHLGWGSWRSASAGFCPQVTSKALPLICLESWSRWLRGCQMSKVSTVFHWTKRNLLFGAPSRPQNLH